MEHQYLANVFVSCSLRSNDKEFIDLVSNILSHFNFNPFGTVGLYDASTDNPIVLMENNIEKCDFVVIAATKRYLTKDTHNNKKSNTLSEMIHAEAGMAFGKSKPIVVFVEEGTNVGNFIPNVTQYITLDKTQENLDSQYNLIVALLSNALHKAQAIKRQKSWKELGSLALKGLAIFGGLKLLEGGENYDYDDEDEEENKLIVY